MAVETERKFLVKGHFKHLATRSTEIIQAYLSTDPQRVVRIRKMDDRAFITIKSDPAGSLMIRNEWEFAIPEKDADEIIKISLPGHIEKTRYYIPAGIHTWEVDEFHGKNDGVIIAEIELADSGEEFDRPEWLGEEVTGNPEYYNVNMIR
jgi:adenylate cyclase